MATLESLRRTIDSIQTLQSVVTTMKALAMVSIRQYERAVIALAAYHRTIEMGLQVVLRDWPDVEVAQSFSEPTRTGAIIFGSDYGMVGQFNEQIVSHTVKRINHRSQPENNRIIAVGERVVILLEETTVTATKIHSVPGSVTGITPLVQELLVLIESWRKEWHLSQLILFYNQTSTGTIYQPTHLHLLPVNEQWLRVLATKPWPSHRLPTYSMDREQLFSSLIRQYLFVSLYRACAESLASENASRLAAMQRAEKNIDERLDDLIRTFNQERQRSITAELLDIVTGVEALTNESRR